MTALRLALAEWPRKALMVDRAWLAVAIIFGVLAILVPGQATESVRFTISALLHVLPFLVLSIAIAAYAKASGADNLIAKAFEGRTAIMILAAAAMGVLSPFCSCGIIPLIAALLSMGVPLAPVMAFWLSSPLMDPSMFVLTVGTLGLDFAVAKTAFAFGIGLLGGYGTYALRNRGVFAEPLREGIGNGGCAGTRVRDPQPVAWSFWKDPSRRSTFAESARDNMLFLGKWLTLAFLLESLMLAYLPADLVVRAVGEDSVFSVLAATAVGIPAYLNGYAALPLIGGLIDQGMAPGAGMAFLLAGGVSSICAAIAVWALARPPVFAAYIGFAVLGAMSAGLLYGLA